MSHLPAPHPSIVVITVGVLHAFALMWLWEQPMVRIDEAPANQHTNIVMAMLAAPLLAPQPKPMTPRPSSLQQPTPNLATQRVIETPGPVKAATPIEAAQTPSVAVGEPSSQTHPSKGASGTASPGQHEQHAPAVVQPSSSAAYLNNPKPPYPALSRRLNEQGMVVVRVLIDTDGKAEQTELFQTSGYSRLDESALKTVTQWRFVPGTRNGVPQAMWFNVPIHFVLE